MYCAFYDSISKAHTSIFETLQVAPNVTDVPLPQSPLPLVPGSIRGRDGRPRRQPCHRRVRAGWRSRGPRASCDTEGSAPSPRAEQLSARKSKSCTGCPARRCRQLAMTGPSLAPAGPAGPAATQRQSACCCVGKGGELSKFLSQSHTMCERVTNKYECLAVSLTGCLLLKSCYKSANEQLTNAGSILLAFPPTTTTTTHSTISSTHGPSLCLHGDGFDSTRQALLTPSVTCRLPVNQHSQTHAGSNQATSNAYKPCLTGCLFFLFFLSLCTFLVQE